jgi:hypothetical protein
MIDFNEIKSPSSGAGRDDFELFARDFFEAKGMKIVEGPDRGPDGGRDLIVEETRKGCFGESKIKWLVSCKHKIGSGDSIRIKDELDISDRVKQHKCGGFIGFYSTIVSAPLKTRLRALASDFEFFVYDGVEIEKELESMPLGLPIIKRYFLNHCDGGKKNENWIYKNNEIKCRCGDEVLSRYKDSRGEGRLFLIGKKDRFDVSGIVFVCKKCETKTRDELLSNCSIHREVNGVELTNPTVFLHRLMEVISELRSGVRYEKESLDDLLGVFASAYQFVEREKTKEENDFYFDWVSSVYMQERASGWAGVEMESSEENSKPNEVREKQLRFLDNWLKNTKKSDQKERPKRG